LVARINFVGAHKGRGCGNEVTRVNQFMRAVEDDPRRQSLAFNLCADFWLLLLILSGVSR